MKNKIKIVFNLFFIIISITALVFTWLEFKKTVNSYEWKDLENRNLRTVELMDKINKEIENQKWRKAEIEKLVNDYNNNEIIIKWGQKKIIMMSEWKPLDEIEKTTAPTDTKKIIVSF